MLSIRSWLPGLAALACACSGADLRPLSAVLITLDTTNPGALDLYGQDRGLTPALAGLARESLVFDAARTVAPLTLPSHASMLTGLYPPRHGVRDNGLVPLPASARTLAERARETGYQTAAFVSAVVLDAPYGLDQGFDVYEAPRGSREHGLAHMVERDADAVTRAAQSWLAQRDPERPFLLWVHYFDPHAPYDPPLPFLRQAGEQPYLGEVAAMDAAIGRLVETLSGEVGLDELALVVVADHGEALGRFGEPTHSVLCYDATMRVPLLVRHPRGLRAGQRSDALVSVVDVFPTFVEMLELGLAGDVDGRSLFAQPDRGRGIYLESYCGYLNHGWSPLAGWIQDGRKYLHSSAPELYDLARDPGESTNLLTSDPDAGRPFRDAIARVYERPMLERARRDALVGDATADLRALGYAGTASPTQELPHPLEPSQRPAPATRTAELEAFYAAALLAGQGRREEAIAAFREIAEETPGSVYARGSLATLLLEERRHEDALKVLEQLIADGHDRFAIRSQLATCLEALDRPQDALRHWKRALELAPGDSDTVEAAARCLERLGRADEAAELRAQ